MINESRRAEATSSSCSCSGEDTDETTDESLELNWCKRDSSDSRSSSLSGTTTDLMANWSSCEFKEPVSGPLENELQAWLPEQRENSAGSLAGRAESKVPTPGGWRARRIGTGLALRQEESSMTALTIARKHPSPWALPAIRNRALFNSITAYYIILNQLPNKESHLVTQGNAFFLLILM